MLAAYAKASARRPLGTNIAVGFGVMFFGDLLSQTLLEHKSLNEVDKHRLLCCSIWNAMFVSPTFLIWFRYLDRVFPGQVVKKTVVNQLVSPLPVNAAFLTYSTVTHDMQGGSTNMQDSLQTAKHRIINDLPTLVASSAMFWLPVNYLNFAYVPQRYRVLPSICGGVIWGSFLTFIGHRKVGVTTT